MTYDFNGYERSTSRRGSPDYLARDIADQEVVDSGLDFSPTDSDVNTGIFTASGGINLLEITKRTLNRDQYDN